MARFVPYGDGMKPTLQQSIFNFDLDRALYLQVEESMGSAPFHTLLTPDVVPQDTRGVYVLYHLDGLSYVGVSASCVRSRLLAHRRKIMSRANIALEEMRFRYLDFGESPQVHTVENMLICEWSPPWNGMGFGSNAPGSGRPGIQENLWDSAYPPRDHFVPYS